MDFALSITAIILIVGIYFVARMMSKTLGSGRDKQLEVMQEQNRELKRIRELLGRLVLIQETK